MFFPAHESKTLPDEAKRDMASSAHGQRCPAGIGVPASLASLAGRRRAGVREKSVSGDLSGSSTWVPTGTQRTPRADQGQVLGLLDQMHAGRIALRRLFGSPSHLHMADGVSGLQRAASKSLPRSASQHVFLPGSLLLPLADL